MIPEGDGSRRHRGLCGAPWPRRPHPPGPLPAALSSLAVSPPAGTEAEHMNTHHTQDSDGRGVRGVTRARKTPSQASAHTFRGCRLPRGPRSFPGLWRLFVFMPGSLCAGPLRVHLPPGGPPPPDVHLAPSLERPSLTTPRLPNPLNGTTPPPAHSQRRRHRNTCLCPF